MTDVARPEAPLRRHLPPTEQRILGEAFRAACTECGRRYFGATYAAVHAAETGHRVQVRMAAVAVLVRAPRPAAEPEPQEIEPEIEDDEADDHADAEDEDPGVAAWAPTPWSEHLAQHQPRDRTSTVPPAEFEDRLLATLATADRPLPGKELRRRTRGDNNALAAAIRRLIAAGRITPAPHRIREAP